MDQQINNDCLASKVTRLNCTGYFPVELYEESLIAHQKQKSSAAESLHMACCHYGIPLHA